MTISEAIRRRLVVNLALVALVSLGLAWVLVSFREEGVGPLGSLVVLRGLGLTIGLVLPSLMRFMTSGTSSLNEGQECRPLPMSLVGIFHAFGGFVAAVIGLSGDKMVLAASGVTGGATCLLYHVTGRRDRRKKYSSWLANAYDGIVQAGKVGAVSGALVGMIMLLSFHWMSCRAAFEIALFASIVSALTEASCESLEEVMAQPLDFEGLGEGGGGALLQGLHFNQEWVHREASRMEPLAATNVGKAAVSSWRDELKWLHAAQIALARRASSYRFNSASGIPVVLLGDEVPAWEQVVHRLALHYIVEVSYSDAKNLWSKLDTRRAVRCCCIDALVLTLQLQLCTYRRDPDILRKSLMGGTESSVLLPTSKEGKCGELGLLAELVCLQQQSSSSGKDIDKGDSQKRPRKQQWAMSQCTPGVEFVHMVINAVVGGTVLLCRSPGTTVGEQMVPSFLCCLAGLYLSIKAEAKSLQAMAHVRIARGPLLLPELLQLSSQLEACMARVCDVYRSCLEVYAFPPLYIQTIGSAIDRSGYSSSNGFNFTTVY